MSLGENIKFYRKQKKMTQNELAQKSYMSRTYLSDIERGRQNPSLNTLISIAKVLNIDIKLLFNEDHHTEIKEKSIGNNIRLYREQKKITQTKLAKKSGISSSHLSMIESDLKKPSIDTLNAIANALNIDVTQIMDSHNDLNKPILYNSSTLTPKDEASYTNATELDQIPTKPPYYMLTKKDEKDIAERLQQMMDDLESNSSLAFMGEPMDEEDRELLRISLENTLRMSKQMAKKKFTPKKYRK
ncbi:helix-turn-helix domain-containing protein [Paenibacillus larvae]